jgi:hypothetical protein
MGTKAADNNAIPLSEGCHVPMQHRVGWPAFAKQFLGGADPAALAAAYWSEWLRTPMGQKWTADHV